MLKYSLLQDLWPNRLRSTHDGLAGDTGGFAVGIAAISLPNIIFMFPGESIATLSQRWDDWVARDATVATLKDQAEDTAGVSFELLRTRMVLRPALTALVAIAEPQLEPVQSISGKLLFKPFNPWEPLPSLVGARFADGDPDTIWLIPRELTADDFQP